MKKSGNFRKIGIMLVLVMLCTMILNPMAKAQEFSDLRPDHWCYNKIIDFEERGYVTGYDDGEFKPDRTITRAEYVTIVNNFFGYDANTENTAKFSDVSEDDWFESYVSEAVKRGYISGYPDGTFRPYEPIRRQEATVILSKILNIADEDYPVDHEDGLAQYADGEEVEDWAYKAVHSYSVYNFINGYEDNTIRLFRNVTRAETVQLLNTVEEKVIIDRDNKTNEVKDRPSGHKKRVATPVITVDETNDTNAWYNKVEARGDGKLTVKVTTTTTNATITVKVNGEVIPTTPFETVGTGVTFDLPEGKYEIVASATRSRYKTSYEAKSNADVDVTAPKVSGKVGDMGVSLSATDNLSGVDEIQYAWFIKDETGYKRVSNWAELKDYIELPAKAQNYYIGVKGSDIAGNKIDGGLKDNVIDDNIVTDGKTDEPYEIVNEAKVISGKDEEQNPEDEPQAGESAITYHKNDGTNVEYVQKLTADATVLKGAIFSRDQYKLIGWAEIATGNKVYDLGETVNFTGDLYAVWQLNEPSDKPIVVEVKGTLTIHYIYENGTKAVEDYTSSLKYGEKYNVSSPEIVGYTADKVTVSGTIEKDKTEITVTYKANEDTKYTVKYYLESEKEGLYSLDEGLTKTLSGTTGENVIAPTITIDHYTENTEIGTRIPSGEIKADGSLELVLYYDRNEYTITFDTDGGSAVNPITQKFGTVIAKPENPTKAGYTFVGWNEEIPTAMPTENTTITAKWKANTYTISYNANGGKNVPSSQEKTHGVNLTLTSDIPTNTGYTFAGWTTNQDGTGENYAAGAVYTANVSATLYAKWVPGTGTKYTVYHYFENVKDTNYTLYKTESDKVGTTDAEITLANEKIAIDGGTYKQGSLTEGGAAVTTTKISSDGTTKIYLYYSRNTYTLTLDKNSNVSSVSGAGTYKYGASVSIDATVGSTNGYTYNFTNWTSSDTSLVPNQTTKSATIEMPASDVTLTANASRTAITYTISYKLDGGAVSEANPTSYTVESETITLKNPTKEGYTFIGWTGTDFSSATTTVTISTGSLGDREYTAKWEKDSSKWHTVKFVAGTNGTFEEAELEYSDILKGTKLKDTDVVIPKPKANSGYEFDSWKPSEPTGNTVVNEDLVFTANFKEKWQAPHVTIDRFESTNVSNEEGNRAEPGTEIEYIVVITNNDTKDAIIDIDPERGMRVVSPESYENIELKPGESITVVVKKTVPKDYSVADDFDADIDVTIKSDKTETADTKKVSESTSNKIEKTTTIRSGEPVNKNIVLTIDVSGSMLFCCTHEEGTWYKFDKNFKIPNEYERLFYGLNTKWSKYPFAGHYYNISKDYLYKNWVECTDSSRIDVVKAALTSFVDNVYNASVANGEEVTITLVTFSDSASIGTTYKLSETNVAQLKKDIREISATGGTRIDKGIRNATDVFGRDSMIKNGTVENYSIFFGDGDGTKPKDNDYKNLKERVQYSYAIGFGPDFLDSSSSAYEVLSKLVKGEGVEVTQAKIASDVTNAFANIADKIATSRQSNEGEVVVTVSNDGKYYPIIATYNNGGEIVTLFTVNNSSELAENNIEIKDTTLTWDISGTKYSDYEGLSIKLGNESEIGPMTLSTPLMMQKELVMPVADEELSDNENQNDSAQKQLVSEGANLAGDSALDIPTLDQEPEAKNGEDESTSNDQSQNVEDKNNETKINETIPSTPTDDSSSDTTPTSVQENEDETKNENTLNESTDDSIQAIEIKEKEAEDETKVEELKDVVPEQVVEEPTGVEEEIDEPKTAEPEQKDDSEKENEEKTGAELEEEPVGTTDSTQPTENGEKQLDEEQTTTEQPIVSEN